VPVVFRSDDGRPAAVPAVPGDPVSIRAGRSLVNPGSVGQPRDGNPAASYLVLDTDADTVEFRRVAYDIDATQKAMRHAGLPPRLAERLSYGR
jgi:diadenosine tetraphosphatase ApaH/serine/threonine PP2A family protein phosphatase